MVGTILKLTKHAEIKLQQRGIPINLIKKVVTKPEMILRDNFDTTLVHFIGKIENKFLRIIGRWQDKNTLLIITAFVDRRITLKKGVIKNDKNNL